MNSGPYWSRTTGTVLGIALLGLLVPAGLLAQATALKVAQTVRGTLTPTDTAVYTIAVDEPSYVLGEVDQISVDVAVRILGTDGAEAARVDALGRGGERFAGRMRTTGTYTIQIVTTEKGGGEYALTLLRREPLETDPEKLTDQLLARYDGPGTPGVAVQVWRDGQTLFSKAYGMANLSYGIPFTTDTRTNIGSTSKQFTAFAIMLQQDQGLLALDDDIRVHIPELPEFDETITVRHLITHTSGLREFLNLLTMTGRRLDHGDWIDRSELIDIVQHQPALQNSPGAEWNYNNTAFGLAALIVERTSGQDFHVFMHDNVFAPLGMTRTMVRPSPAHIVPDRSEGYTPGPDGFLELGDLGGAVGAGGIYSTVEDLQKWAENYANPKIGSAEIFDEMMTSYALTNGDETGYGYGLGVDEQGGLRRIQHNGADVAHRSGMAYYPEINAGVTTQSNHADFNSGLAFQIAEAFFADAMETHAAEGDAGSADAFDPAAYDRETFDVFVGRYALDVAPDFILSFTREGDSLYTQATGQERLSMTPLSDSSFALNQVEASVTFLRDEDGGIQGLTLDQNGQNHATRLADDEDTDAWTPSASDLKAFEGRYFSDEIETFYDVLLVGEALVVSQRRLDDATLTPGNQDTFTGADMTFLFERDRNQKIIGFYLSNVRSRDVRFGRVR